MLCGLLDLHLGHDLDLGLGHGRPLLGGGEAVLEGGDLGHQVALGQECVVQLGLGFQCGVTLAAQALWQLLLPALFFAATALLAWLIGHYRQGLR